MVDSGNELNVNSKNQFFSNNDIPYCLKAGAVAVLSHATVDYHKTRDGQDVFMAMLFDKDIDKNGKANRIVSGAIDFTFAVHASMGVDNCSASLKKFRELYPAVGDALDSMAENNFKKSDEDMCGILANASAERFRHSEEGMIKNFEKYVSDNFDTFQQQTQSHYPGLISSEVFENLKRDYENACKKKPLAQQQRM